MMQPPSIPRLHLEKLDKGEVLVKSIMLLKPNPQGGVANAVLSVTGTIHYHIPPGSLPSHPRHNWAIIPWVLAS